MIELTDDMRVADADTDKAADAPAPKPPLPERAVARMGGEDWFIHGKGEQPPAGKALEGEDTPKGGLSGLRRILAGPRPPAIPGGPGLTSFPA